jgi:hypothetical protein
VLAVAPMTAVVTDSEYSVPIGQIHGVPEIAEQGNKMGGSTRAKAAGKAIKRVQGTIIFGYLEGQKRLIVYASYKLESRNIKYVLDCGLWAFLSM